MSCVNYDFNISHLIFPSRDIYRTLCYSQDKTNLFLVSFFRLVFYIILYSYISDLNMQNDEKKYVNMVAFVLVLVNTIYLMISYRKQQKFDKEKN